MGFFTKKELSLPSSFKEIIERDSLRIIRLKGPLDTEKEVEMQKFIVDFRKQKTFRFKNLLLDFKEVTYVDSSAVAQLIKTLFDYRKANQNTGIVHLNDTARRLLEVMKIDQLLRVYASEAEAIKDLER